MKIDENENALKGQQIIVRGNVPDLRESSEIVRAITFIKEKFMFRTKKLDSCFPKMMFSNSVRKELFALFIEFPQTFFYLFLLPQTLSGA